MITNRFIKTTILLPLFIVASITPFVTFATPSQTLYQIELIVFKDSMPEEPMTEQWDPNSNQGLNPHNAISLKPIQPHDEKPTSSTNTLKTHQLIKPYTLLPHDKLTMDKAEKLLQKKKQYRLISHIAWIQPIDNKNNANTVRFSTGKLFAPNGEIIASIDSQHIDQPTAYTTQLDHHNQWELQAKIQISQGSYFNMTTDLTLTEPVTEKIDSFIWQFWNKDDKKIRLQQYQIYQLQRMKLDEVHYFDHPLFGALVKITKVKPQHER